MAFLKKCVNLAYDSGQRHRKKVKQKLDAGEEVDYGNSFERDQELEAAVVPEKKEYKCDLCDLTVPTEASMEFHLKGL